MKDRVVIPIHPLLKLITNRYKDSSENYLPRSMENQVLNRHLKGIGAMLKSLQVRVPFERTQAGLKVVKRITKFELLTTHTARRSFATNAYLDGVPSITIMNITGHRTEVAFLKYIKVTPSEHAKILKEHWERTSHLKAV